MCIICYNPGIATSFEPAWPTIKKKIEFFTLKKFSDAVLGHTV